MLAIIPARKGSKGLPNKNIKRIKNKPLISYTIEAALKSKKIDNIFISTNDKRIISIAKNYKLNIPFMRPDELATDNSPAIKTYLHTIKKLEKIYKKNIKNFVVLLPTSPLRSTKDIDNSIELFFKKKANSVISMSEANHPVHWHKNLKGEGKINSLFKNNLSTMNRQKLKKTYIPNGSIYVFDYNFLKKKMNYYGHKSYAYIMPKLKSYDIDDFEDFEIVKYILSNKKL